MRIFRRFATIVACAITTVLGFAVADPAAAAPRKVNGGTVNTEHGVRVWRASHPVAKIHAGHHGCCGHAISQAVVYAPTPIYAGGYVGGGVSHRFRPLVLRTHRGHRHHH